MDVQDPTATNYVVPPHVPASLVYDFDHFNAPELTSQPQARVSARLHADAPPIFWSPRQGGYWIVSRAEPAIDMLRQPELFSSLPTYNKAKDFDPPILPIQSDPPLLDEYRRILNPVLAPGSVHRLESMVRDLATEIVGYLAPRGECEFVTEVEAFPITIFLKLAGAPMADRARLVKIAQKYARSPVFAERAAAVKELAAYLREKLAERRGAPPDNLLARVANAQVNGRPITAVEEEGMATLIFLGGLDTVKSALSFAFAYLAKHPEQYAKLVQNPALIPGAVEELLRVAGTSTPERGASHDFEYRGIQFHQGDRVVFLCQIYGMDPEFVSNPHEIKFDRDVAMHLAFGAGPHRCIGSHLARMEIRLFIEEWIKRIPAFGTRNDEEIRTECGIVWSPAEVNLVWPVS